MNVIFYSDDIILFMLSLLVLILILYSLKISKSFSFINLTIFIIYSIFFYRGLFFEAKYGSGFIWCRVNAYKKTKNRPLLTI